MQCYVHLCKQGTESLACVHNSTLGVANFVGDSKAECKCIVLQELKPTDNHVCLTISQPVCCESFCEQQIF